MKVYTAKVIQKAMNTLNEHGHEPDEEYYLKKDVDEWLKRLEKRVDTFLEDFKNE